MSGESLVGLVASMSALVGAVFTGLVALRREGRDSSAADVLELRAYRDAWVWAVRTITKLLAGYGINQLEEPAGVREQMAGHQEILDNPTLAAKHKKEAA